jgi:hypothetical protein
MADTSPALSMASIRRAARLQWTRRLRSTSDSKRRKAEASLQSPTTPRAPDAAVSAGGPLASAANFPLLRNCHSIRVLASGAYRWEFLPSSRASRPNDVMLFAENLVWSRITRF